MSIAALAIKRTIQRRATRKVLLKDSKAYGSLYGQLQTALTNAWNEAMREGITNALDRLRDLGPGKFTADDGKMLLRVLEGSVGEEAIRAAMREPVINLTDALFRVGAEEVGQSVGVSIAFMRPDLDALDVLKTGNLYWVGNSWNVRNQNLMAAALDEYFTSGMTREQLTARFAQDFGTLTERGQRYWELLADHTATKTREMGRVSGYGRAGVTRVQVRAQLDEKTSRICRQMHGRIITVSDMRAQRDTYLQAASARNEPAMKAAWLMHGVGADFARTPTSKLGKGTASPPYHFRCRTITVMYVETDQTPLQSLRQRIVDREQTSLGDKTYVTARAGDAAFLGAKQARAKFQRHRANIPSTKLKTYEADARALLVDPKTTLLLSTRVPLRNKADRPGEVALHAVFAKEHYNPHKKQTGQLVTVVDLEENVIISHHWRENQSSEADITPARVVKRILKWLTD